MLSLILCLILTLGLPLTAPAEAPAAAAETMAFYTGVSGNVAFALPGAPEMLSEADMQGHFSDSRQLVGACMEDEAEYQLRSGDIAGFIEGMRKELAVQMPGATEDVIRVNALMSYCFMIPGTYGAQVLEANPHGSKETGWLWIDYTFVYPDTPDVTYYGKAMLAGTRATGIVMAECPHTQDVLDRLRFLTDEELAAEKAAMEQETVCSVHGLEMTFPREPVAYAIGGAELTGAFCADWSSLTVQYQPVSAAVDPEDETLQASLIDIARQRMLVPYGTEQVNDPVMTFPAEGIAQLDFTTVNETSLGPYGQPMRCRLCIGEGGLWYIYAADTDTGRAFLDSMHFGGVEETQAAKTFPEFRDNLDALLPEGTLVWADPICSDGEWVRAGVSLTADLGGVLVYTDSSAEDAAIREIRILQMDGMSAETLALSEKCVTALSGESVTLEAPASEEAVQTAGGVQVGVQHFDPEDSTLVYDRVHLVPEEVPEKREEIPWPGDVEVKHFEHGPTAAEFDERLARIRPLLLPDSIMVEFVMADDTPNGPVRVYRFGNEAIMLYLDGTEEDARISLAVIMSFDQNPPQVVGATMLTFAVLADADEADCRAISYILLETPMWDQLADRWPLLCRGGLCASLQQDGAGDDWQPMGFIAGTP